MTEFEKFARERVLLPEKVNLKLSTAITTKNDWKQ